jgi:hypothetical protein
MDAVADIERERDDGMRARASKRVVTLQTGTNRRLYCGSAWNKDPVFGVIGIQSGPLGTKGDSGLRIQRRLIRGC